MFTSPALSTHPEKAEQLEQKRLEQYAFKRAHDIELPEAVSLLVDLLGVQLVAIIGGVTDGRRVRDWKSGKRDPRDTDSERALRFALQLAIMVTRDCERSPRIAQAWFQGGNPILGYQAPAMVLRAGHLDDTGYRLVDAARSFIGD
jgi:hypothetical protein